MEIFFLYKNSEVFKLFIISFIITIFLYSPVGWSKYTKISNNGKYLPDSAVLGSGPDNWACTYDSSTKLIWEIKTTDNGLHDKNWTYTWYDTNSSDGNKGTPNGNSYTQCKNTGRCDTEKFTQDVNTQGLCGSNNWRMPTISEFITLLYCSNGNGVDDNCEHFSSTPTIDTYYFPNTTVNHPAYSDPYSVYWSGTSYYNNPRDAETIDFYYGSAHGPEYKRNEYYVRLVHDGDVSIDTAPVESPAQPYLSMSSTEVSPNNEVVFTFSDVPNATKYELCFFKQPNQKDVIFCIQNITKSPYSYTVQENDDYYVAVKALKGNLESDFSNEVHLVSTDLTPVTTTKNSTLSSNLDIQIQDVVISDEQGNIKRLSGNLKYAGNGSWTLSDYNSIENTTISRLPT